jgi:hypothetical protein
MSAQSIRRAVLFVAIVQFWSHSWVAPVRAFAPTTFDGVVTVRGSGYSQLSSGSVNRLQQLLWELRARRAVTSNIKQLVLYFNNNVALGLPQDTTLFDGFLRKIARASLAARVQYAGFTFVSLDRYILITDTTTGTFVGIEAIMTIKNPSGTLVERQLIIEAEENVSEIHKLSN